MDSKAAYEKLDLQVIRFDSEDVIVTSLNEGEIVGNE
jgi:hypothetical protein